MSNIDLKSIFTTLALIIVSTCGLLAQSGQSSEAKTEFSIEIDPSTFAFSGYGFHLRVKPKNSEHLLLGVGVYAMDFPDLIVDLNPENKDKGWDVRLSSGIGLFGEYHFTEVNKKFFVGTQLAIQNYEIEHDVILGQAAYSTFLALGYGGYTWQPFEFPLYFKFWGGLGYTAKTSGETTVGNLEHDVSPLLMFGALHLGYTF